MCKRRSYCAQASRHHGPRRGEGLLGRPVRLKRYPWAYLAWAPKVSVISATGTLPKGLRLARRGRGNGEARGRDGASFFQQVRRGRAWNTSGNLFLPGKCLCNEPPSPWRDAEADTARGSGWVGGMVKSHRCQLKLDRKQDGHQLACHVIRCPSSPPREASFLLLTTKVNFILYLYD